MAKPRPQRLVSTNTAALYLLYMEDPERPPLFRRADVKAASTRIYNAARDKKIKRYGDETWGGARWDLTEVHQLLRTPPK